MDTAQRLLRDHKAMQARFEMLEMLLEKEPDESTDGEMIRGIVLSGKPLDIPPVKSARGSSTEYAAIHYRDKLVEAYVAQKELAEAYRTEMEFLKSDLRLYGICIKALTDEERLFVELHYDNRLSLARLADQPIFLQGAYSLSTLKRIQRKILIKMQNVLNIEGSK